MSKIELRPAWELNFAFKMNTNIWFLGKVTNAILGLPPAWELDFDVVFRKHKEAEDLSELRVFEGCPMPNASFYKQNIDFTAFF